MDNVSIENATSSQTPPGHSPSIITLDSSQYFFYQTNYVEIQAPNGAHLSHIGKAIQQEQAENQIFRVREQVALVTCLLKNIDEDLSLSIPAVLGLTDLLEKVQEVCYQAAR